MFKNKKAFSTMEIIVGCVLIFIIGMIFMVFFVGGDSKNPVEKIKKMGYTLQQVVQYGEGAVNKSSLDWDYSLPANEFFKKYLDEYMNYSHMLERNLEYKDEGTVYYIYFVDDSFIQLKKGVCMEYHYDANGAHKPNVYGQDQYIFYLCPRAHAGKNNFINKM